MDWAEGQYTRTGPDDVETLVQLDVANRVESVRRGPAGDPVMTAAYTYYDDGLVKSVSYGNGTSVWYWYDNARRVTCIQHKDPLQMLVFRLDYFYTDRDEVERIEEYALGPGFFTVEFDYDNRGRLTHERRFPSFGGDDVYNLTYEYDQGGNRTAKIDTVNGPTVMYEYDVDDLDPNPYDSRNNRLMKAETLDATTYYYYSEAGNVTRVVTKTEDPPPEERQFSATRFGYAQNGQAVTYILGEEWDWDGEPENCPTEYDITYAREFRYDGARARYLNRVLKAEWIEHGYFIVDTETWSDYDGDDIYGDFEVVGGNVTNLRSFEPGIGRADPWTASGSASTSYYHANLIGTTRFMSNSVGAPVENVSYTAFGERIAGTNHRYGYAGAWGYQAHDFPEEPADPIPYLHVGARYYDPATGRFLQRDPIGIRGGLNVYLYTDGNPVLSIDPTGLGWLKRIWDNAVKIAKKIAGKLTGKSCPPISAPIVPVVTALEGGPDVVRIWVACGHRAKSLRDGSSADDMLDRYERGRGKFVKPGKGW